MSREAKARPTENRATGRMSSEEKQEEEKLSVSTITRIRIFDLKKKISALKSQISRYYNAINQNGEEKDIKRNSQSAGKILTHILRLSKSYQRDIKEIFQLINKCHPSNQHSILTDLRAQQDRLEELIKQNSNIFQPDRQ